MWGGGFRIERLVASSLGVRSYLTEGVFFVGIIDEDVGMGILGFAIESHWMFSGTRT